jgi:hypothetical protein
MTSPLAITMATRGGGLGALALTGQSFALSTGEPREPVVTIDLVGSIVQASHPPSKEPHLELIMLTLRMVAVRPVAASINAFTPR